jgi:alpha-methylacyl-CoA racemase
MSRLNNFLRGLRVLDLSRHVPGPLATLVLADMGADVLKIEPPIGDEMRMLGPKYSDGRSIYFESLNAGKTTRRMNLKNAGERTDFLSLVMTADVLVESFRPGIMTRLGLGYGTLKQVNPGLIYCSINGYGYKGPLAQYAGHDANYLAICGALHRNVGDGKPMFFDPPIADSTGSLMAVIAILGALSARVRDGRGCEIDLALADAIMFLQTYQLAELGRTHCVPQPKESYLNGGAAYYQVYQTADFRHITLGAIETKFWEAFCTAAARRDWIPRHGDPIPQHSLTGELSAMFVGLTLSECIERFYAVDCCFAPVLDLNEAAQSEYHRDRGFLRRGSDDAFQALFPASVDGNRPTLREPLKDLGNSSGG